MTANTKKNLKAKANKTQPAQNPVVSDMSLCSVPWDDKALPVSYPVAVMGVNEKTPEQMGHVMIIGASGSGKTASAIKPLTTGMFNYLSGDGLRYSALVVDPKHELLPYLLELDAQQGEQRVVNITGGLEHIGLDPFEGIEDFASLEDKCEFLYKHFNPGGLSGGENQIFKNSGLALLLSCIKMDQAYYEHTGQSLFATACALIAPHIEEPTLFEGLRLLMQGGLAATRYTLHWPEGMPISIADSVAEMTVFDVLYMLLDRLDADLVGLFEPLKVYQKEAARPVPSSKEQLRQFSFYVSYWDLMLTALCDKRMKQAFNWDYLYKPSRPGEGPLSQFIDNEHFIVLSPTRMSHVDELIVALVKRSVFSLMLTRTNKLAPMAFIADEFQNFISSDTHTGEHNFLDRCRSYRVNCVLGTQSIAHLRNKVAEQQGQTGLEALEAMLNNITNHMVFRSTDMQTSRMLRNAIPISPLSGGQHVIDVRPPAGLKVGECYYVSAQGTWGRKQVRIPENLPPLMPRAQQDEINLHC